MHLTSDRKGTIGKENSMQDRLLGLLYGTRLGRMLVRPLVSPRVTAGRADTGLSDLSAAHTAVYPPA